MEETAEDLMKDSQTLRTQYRVGDFVAWQRDGALELNPNFQRRPVWKKGAKSYLIDTILRGLPMPIIFLRDLRADLKTFKAKRDVVDGQQRIRTILSFIDPTLLKDFNPDRDKFTINPAHNKELGGKTYAELSDEYKQRVLDYQFSAHSFPADTDDREILQIFARMNSTGVKLNAQELRNAEFNGPFKKIAYELATEQLNRWRDWRIFTPDQIARMNEVELSSEFMIFILQGILEKTNRTIDNFYSRYETSFDDSTEVSTRFRTTFDTIESLLSKELIATLFSNRTTFYALFATIYGLHFRLRSPKAKYGRLTHEKAKPIRSSMAGQLKNAVAQIKDKNNLPPRILKALRGATTHASERTVVIGFLAGKDDDPCRMLN
jgi:uncharacterized protein with ParB-like and HNH nuclease domain